MKILLLIIGIWWLLLIWVSVLGRVGFVGEYWVSGVGAEPVLSLGIVVIVQFVRISRHLFADCFIMMTNIKS